MLRIDDLRLVKSYSPIKIPLMISSDLILIILFPSLFLSCADKSSKLTTPLIFWYLKLFKLKSPIKSFILFPLNLTTTSPFISLVSLKPKLCSLAKFIVELKSKSTKSLLKSINPLKSRFKSGSFKSNFPSKTWFLTFPKISNSLKTLSLKAIWEIFPVTSESKNSDVKPRPEISNLKFDFPIDLKFMNLDILISFPSTYPL